MRITRRIPLVFLASLMVFAIGSMPVLADDSEVKVMTRNIYLGADLSRPLAARTPAEFFAAVAAAFAQVQATNFPERAESLAGEIDERKPDLIGLQEVALWRSQFPADFSPIPNATAIEYDFLALLLEAIDDRGLDYSVVIIGNRADIEAPGITAQGLKDYRLTMRDVILVRVDGDDDDDLELSNVMQNPYVTNLVLPTLGGPVVFTRGWASVDVTTDEETFRFVNTHLEAFAEPVRSAQAAELLAGPANTELSVILVGDYNAAPGTPTYGQIISAGFVDAAVEQAEEGFTCCQAADLRNEESILRTRVDLVLFRGNVSSEDVRRVGHRQRDRTPSGLWPSDHAGVVAKLEIGEDDDDDDEGDD